MISYTVEGKTKKGREKEPWDESGKRGKRVKEDAAEDRDTWRLIEI